MYAHFELSQSLCSTQCEFEWLIEFCDGHTYTTTNFSFRLSAFGTHKDILLFACVSLFREREKKRFTMVMSQNSPDHQSDKFEVRINRVAPHPQTFTLVDNISHL